MTAIVRGAPWPAARPAGPRVRPPSRPPPTRTPRCAHGSPHSSDNVDWSYFYTPYDPADPVAGPGQLLGGYWPDKPGNGEPTGFHYGALNTEPRMASYLGIADGSLPADHYWHLYRTLLPGMGQEQEPADAYVIVDGVRVWEGHYAIGMQEDGYNSLAVVTPHASFLALPQAPDEALTNLRALARDFGAYDDRYGFRDSVDVVTGRVSDVVLALYQGMIAAALAGERPGTRRPHGDCLDDALTRLRRAILQMRGSTPQQAAAGEAVIR